MSDSALRKYLVTVNTPNGEGSMEVTSTSEGSAGNRVKWAAIHRGWGDVGEVTVVTVKDITDPE